MKSYKEHFNKTLTSFINVVEKLSYKTALASWELETTGKKESANKLAKLSAELTILFSNKKTYKIFLEIEKHKKELDEIEQRQLNELIRAFKSNMLPKKLIQEEAKMSAELANKYANFRAELNGKKLSENEILDVLKNENNVEIRKKYWEASKQIGDYLAKDIINLVKHRNKSAKILGYKDYYKMALDLQEVDQKWLIKTLNNLCKKSNAKYKETIEFIEKNLAQRFKIVTLNPTVTLNSFQGLPEKMLKPVQHDKNGVIPTSSSVIPAKAGIQFKTSPEDLGPWAWSDPFCQEDPLPKGDADKLMEGKDIVEISKDFYKNLGLDVTKVIEKSDLYEREGKNQHAFCNSMDRKEDVRALCNLKPTIRWMDTMLHELGHAVYDLNIDKSLPWLLRSQPHILTTEAMALLAGFQAYQEDFLKKYITQDESKLTNVKEIRESQKRRQLIFSRWVMVMMNFEAKLYENPNQNLNKLWWKLVEKYQLVKAPKNREKKNDWAAKYHVGLAPVYYHSYLLGEMLSSKIKEQLKIKTGKSSLVENPKAGEYLREKLFKPGDRWNWNEMIKKATGNYLNEDAWVNEFTS